MTIVPESFAYDYCGCDLRYGRGCVNEVAGILADNGLERALLVTGSNVGSNPSVMDPIRESLRSRMVGHFDGTTPAKRAATAFDGIEAIREADPDVLVGVGGGSSLDIARQISAFAADGRPLAAYRNAALDGRLEPPIADDPTPVILVPTTFAGAALSSGGSVEVLPPEDSPTGDPVRTSGSVTPLAVIEDPALYETTPMGALAGSAMNGFNKGLETIYSRDSTAITDATAVRGLRLLTDALPRLPDDPTAMERAVAGSLLVQFERRTSIIHAFGHGFARRYDVQQGIAHAVMVPHVLRFLFDRDDARRSVVADALGLDTAGMDDAGVADAIIAAVTAVRDSLDLPSRIRDLDAVPEDDLPAIARFVLDDAPMDRTPSELDPTATDLEDVLRAAW